MILNFNHQFVGKIKAGTKVHTIRRDVHARWKPGIKIQLAMNARTRFYTQFDEKVCISVQDITILYKNERGEVHFIIDNNFLLGIWDRFAPENSINAEAITEFVRNDGFDNVDEFLKWFKRDFTGRIIHWTEMRY